MNNILVKGYGSIGKKHSKNLVSLGYNPCVITKYPDNDQNIIFLEEIKELYKNNINIDSAIICTQTSSHLKDVKDIVENTNCNKILIEKPIEISIEKANKIKKTARDNNVEIFIAYNMRFYKIFQTIKKYIKDYFSSIRLVKITVGQYLPEWRSNTNYRFSYSSDEQKGGGVDLDLSHEIDYMLWLFGEPENKLFLYKDKLSNLEINSSDYFKGIYKYDNFIIDLDMDYFRKKERNLHIIGENENIIKIDFINKKASFFNDNLIMDEELFSGDCYIDEIKEFLGLVDTKNLCDIDHAIKVLKFLGK